MGRWLKVFWNPPVVLSRWIRDTWFKAWTGRYCAVDRFTSEPQATKLPANLQRSVSAWLLSNLLYEVRSRHLIVLSQASAIISHCYLFTGERRTDRGKFFVGMVQWLACMVTQLFYRGVKYLSFSETSDHDRELKEKRDS